MTANLSNSLFVAFVGGNYWISLVNVDCEPYNWKVYDSLGYENEALKCSLKKLYPNSDVIWIKKEKVQRQKGSNDCGLFALAFLFCVCLGINPVDYKFNQCEMRSHYLNCLHTNSITVFPGEIVREKSSRIKKNLQFEILGYTYQCTYSHFVK